jgi:membrane fusion protein
LHITTPSESQPSLADPPLFRKEAVDHQRIRLYGTVILARAPSHVFLTCLFTTIALAIIAFFIFFSTTRKAQCQGVLLPTAGVIGLVSVQAGVVAETRVKEGQTVHAGDVLFVLSSERSSSAAASTQKNISALLETRRDSFAAELTQAQLQSRQRLAATQRRAQDLENDIERIGEQINLQQNRVGLTEQGLKRYSELHATNYISASQLQDKQVELIDQRQRLAELRRAQAAGRRDLASALAELSDLKVQAQREAYALKRNVSEVDQDLTESEARREVLVRAPQDGMVTAIRVNAGQAVPAGNVLASLLPAGGELEAEIYAPSRSAGFIKLGMRVLLRYQAYPYQKFGQYTAQVHEIANTSMSPQDLALPGAATATASEPLYRIRLKLDKQAVQAYGKEVPLKSGMLVDASIVLEQRRLYEWVLEPLFSISGRI